MRVTQHFIDNAALLAEDRKSMDSLSYCMSICFLRRGDGFQRAYDLCRGIRQAGYYAAMDPDPVKLGRMDCVRISTDHVPQWLHDDIQNVFYEIQDQNPAVAVSLKSTVYRETPINPIMRERLLPLINEAKPKTHSQSQSKLVPE